MAATRTARRSSRKRQISREDFALIVKQLRGLVDLGEQELAIYQALDEDVEIEVYRLGTTPLALQILGQLFGSARAALSQQQLRRENEELQARLAREKGKRKRQAKDSDDGGDDSPTC